MLEIRLILSFFFNHNPIPFNQVFINVTKHFFVKFFFINNNEK